MCQAPFFHIEFSNLKMDAHKKQKNQQSSGKSIVGYLE